MTEPSNPWATPVPPPAYPVPGWGPPPAPAGPMNRWAVVALVTGIVAVFPVAIGAGIAALVQISRRGQRGMALAITGLVLGVGWILVGLIVLAVVAIGSGDPSPLGRVGEAGSSTVGACLVAPRGDNPQGTVIDCARAHDAEVFAVELLGGQSWPGSDEINREARDICTGAFEPYTGEYLDSSPYDYGYFDPDRQDWAAGERRVVCVVTPLDGDRLPRSVRGTD